MSELTIYNTLTRRKERFVPRHDRHVQMFVCGPTVYDLSHVGHAKTFVQFDIVARYLRFCGYSVEHVQNITDVDDKIIARANEVGVPAHDLARRFERAFIDDMRALHIDSVDTYARAHDFVSQIVDQVQRLIRKGCAYELDDGWYFDLSTFSGYGKLSGRTMTMADDAVSRIDEHHGKRNAGDFALWKRSKPGEPCWNTPLGPGRPGWHIEDTAITESIFGPQYDLHGGAADLIFPHHEAEIAQMESASGLAPLATYWMHAGFLRTGGAKMSKSLGNFQTIREALRDVDYRTLRYALLSHHYRSAMELTSDVLDAAHAARTRIEAFVRSVDRNDNKPDAGADAAREAFYRRLNDDFDTPGAFASLFTFIREANRRDEPPGGRTWEFLAEFNSLFDVVVLDQQKDDEIDARVRARDELRQQGRYEEADQIRAELASEGILISDTVEGARWWRKT